MDGFPGKPKGRREPVGSGLEQEGGFRVEGLGTQVVGCWTKVKGTERLAWQAS